MPAMLGRERGFVASAVGFEVFVVQRFTETRSFARLTLVALAAFVVAGIPVAKPEYFLFFSSFFSSDLSDLGSGLID